MNPAKKYLSQAYDSLTQLPDATMITNGTKTTVVGGVTAGLGGATSSAIASWGGMIIAAIGLLVTAFYGWHRHRREREWHAIRLETERLRQQAIRDSGGHAVVCEDDLP